jgi:uncharacterized protein (DUF1800 family)
MKLRMRPLPLVRALFAAVLLLPAAVRADIDLNSNGISDVWELLHEDAVDPAGDADGDGQTNLQEFIFGTDPMSAAERFGTPTLAYNPATGQLDVSWPSAAGKRYQLQSCADLAAGEWANDGSAVMGTGAPLSVSRAPGSLAKMYLRVQVTDVDTDGDSLTNWEELTLGLNPDDRSNGTGSGTGDAPPPPPVDLNVVTMKATAAFAHEDGPADGRVTFLRAGDVNPLMVGYSVSGTATKGVDHTTVNAWFPLAANTQSKTLDVKVLADALLESTESVTVTITWVLSIQPGGTVTVLPGSPNRATVIINNTTEATGTGLLAQYYDTSSTTYTNPANFAAPATVTRIDPTVNFDWLQGTPNANTQLASTDNYSVRWEGYLSPTTAGNYVFQLDADDRARVLLDTDGAGPAVPVQILENGWDTTATGGFKQSATYALVVPPAAADRYRIIVEFVETTGSATCRLQWRLGTGAFANIPNANVFQNNTGAGNGFVASFYDDTTFTALAGTQTNVNVTDGNNGIWGEGTPDAALLHRDSFSARWTGQVQPQFSEEYTFVVNCDDAAKLWVNGQPLTLLRSDTNAVIDWPTNTTTDRYARVALLAGVRYDIRLDYFESTGASKCQLSWYSPSQPKQIIPSTRLYPANGPMQGAQQSSPSEAFAVVGGPFSYAITATNGATISITGRPTWLTFSGGVLSGTPPAGTAGVYQIVITTTSAAGAGTSVLNLTVEDNTTNPIVREYWSGVSGTAVSDIPTSTSPTDSGTLASLEAPTNFGDDYGARIRGYVTAPVTGNYYFWIAGNNAAELWISNDTEPVNAIKRASIAAGSATPRNWTVSGSQKSPWLALEAGQKYYIEVLHKAGAGAGDNLAVGWLKPGQSGSVPSEVVPGSVLSAYLEPAPGSNPGTLYLATMLSQNGAATNGVGNVTMRMSEDENYVDVRYTYSGLTGVLTDWHIHNDPYLTSGSSIMYDPNAPSPGSGPLPDNNPPTLTSHRWVIPNTVGTLSKADVVELIKQGKSYVNLHTALYPAGEIRGNLNFATGSRTFSAPPAPPSWTDDHNTHAGATRFLTQATFGPSLADIAALQAMASYEAWIDDQFTKPASLQLPEVSARELSDAGGGAQFDETLSFNAWWRNSINGEDQLRQRVTFALSEIHVVSAQGPLDNRAEALSFFYDKLAENAFGNFRDILEATTLTPTMGRYLDMLRNDKPDQAVGRIPNENYGREIKQLFSIGLFRLWPDGTLILNSQDEPIVTYTQREIVGYSHVLTGWDYGYDGGFKSAFSGGAQWTRLMREVPGRHFTGPKRMLNNEVLPGLTTVGGQPLDPYATHTTTQFNDASYQALPAQELDALHDQLFNHPNVGPFICRTLIQRMVTSHPSRDYVYRVVQAFNDNGSGVRGDMKAVIKAILLDYEARSIGAGSASVKPTYGKQREAVLRVAAPARAFRQPSFSGTYTQTSGSHVINISGITGNKLVAGNAVYLDFPHGAFVPGDTTPTSQLYTVMTAPAPTATSFSVNAKGWIGINTSTGGNGTVTGSYAQTAGSTSMTITLSGHWLPAGGKAWLDFTTTTTGTAMTDGVYTAVTSTSTSGGGTTFTITAPDTTARTGLVRMVGFRGSYTVSSSGLAAPNERRITFDTTNWFSSNEIADHHLVVGNSVFANFTAGNPIPPDREHIIESVPDANTFTVLTDLAGTGGGNDSDNGMWIFPLVAQPTARTGSVTALPSTFNMGNTNSDLDQTPLNSPTVFNFFLPDFKFPGSLASLGITTPEFQDTAETTVIRQSNFIYNGLFNPGNTNGIGSFRSGSNALVLDFSPWFGNATDLGLGAGTQAGQPWTNNANLSDLIDQMSMLLVANGVSATTRTYIREFLYQTISSIPVSNPCSVTTPTPHGLTSGDTITISGVTGGTFRNSGNTANVSINQAFTVTVTSATSFTLNISGGIRCTSTAGLNLTSAHFSPIAYNNTTPSDTNKRDRLRAILHLILTSPDYTIQR